MAGIGGSHLGRAHPKHAMVEHLCIGHEVRMLCVHQLWNREHGCIDVEALDWDPLHTVAASAQGRPNGCVADVPWHRGVQTTDSNCRSRKR